MEGCSLRVVRCSLPVVRCASRADAARTCLLMLFTASRPARKLLRGGVLAFALHPLRLTPLRPVASQHAHLTLPPRAPLLLVPSTQTADVRGRFHITVLSGAPVALRQLGRGYSASATGEWRSFSEPSARLSSNAGGCRGESTWGANPQFALWRWHQPIRISSLVLAH